MEIENLGSIVAGHALFRGFEAGFLDLVAGCARNVRFDAGAYLCHEGEPANEIFLVRHGKVGMELSSPERGSMVFRTAGPNEIVGLGWLVPPYRWTFDARAMELTRAISLDAKCLRDKCEADHHLGYEVMKRFTPFIVDELQTTRLQVLDLYGAAR